MEGRERWTSKGWAASEPGVWLVSVGSRWEVFRDEDSRWRTSGRIGIPGVPLRTWLPWLNVLKLPSSFFWPLCPLSGPRFSAWDHVHLATMAAPNSVVCHWSWLWIVFQSFPQFNPYSVPRWSLWTRVLHTQMVSGAVLAAPEFLGSWMKLQICNPRPMGLGVQESMAVPASPVTLRSSQVWEPLLDTTLTQGSRQEPGPLGNSFM